MLCWLIWAAQWAHAQDMSFLNPRSARSPSIFAESTESQTGVDLVDSRFGGQVPIHQTPQTVWTASLRAQRLELGETLVIPNRQLAIPKDFGGADIGIGVVSERDSKTQGFNASLGTTGRQLFNEENSRVINANYFREWKSTDHSWYLFLNYSNNRTWLNHIPIPGFAYAVNRPTYRLMLGAPFIMINYFPGRWRWQLFTSPFFNSTSLSYSLKAPWQATTSVSWQPRSYQNIAPDVDDEMLLYDRKEWTIGLAFNPAPPISASLLYVYQFDRRFFVGESISQQTSDEVRLADSGGASFRLRWAF